MQLKNEPRIGLELSLKKVVVIASAFTILLSTAIFIYSNLSSSTESMASTQSSTISWSCTGPAGIGDNSTNRFYYDLDSQSYSNGSPISSLTNLGGNGTAWSQSSSSKRPHFKTGSWAMNGHPVIHFDGNDDFLYMSDQNDLNKKTSNERTFMVAFRTGSDINTRQVIYEEGGTSRGLNIYLYGGKLYLGGWNRANDGSDAPWNFSYVDSAISANSEYIVTYIYDGSTNNTTSGKLIGYLNGGYMGTTGGIGQLYAHGDDIGLGAMNQNSYFENGAGNGSNHYFTGDIATFIAYNYALDTAQRVILENSLSSKFDIAIANDYFSFDTNGYSHHVAGIGMSGNDENTCAASGNMIQISNPTDLDSGEYLLFGHNLDAGASGSGNPSGIHSRWNQKIMFEEHGDVGDVDVTLRLDQAEFNIGDPDDIELLIDVVDDGDMTNAQTVSGTYDSIENTITFTGVTVGNNTSFMVGSTSSVNALPVEFLYFRAEFQDGLSLLNWATATEINNSHFDIERSLDGRSFKVIDREMGNGNANNVIEYEYIDQDVPLQSTPIYYRLKQVDFDGSFEYSPVVYVLQEDKEKCKVYPNPASSVLNIEKPGYQFRLQLVNHEGNVVRFAEDIHDQTQLSVQDLSNGYYILQIEDASGSESHKILVRH